MLVFVYLKTIILTLSIILLKPIDPDSPLPSFYGENPLAPEKERGRSPTRSLRILEESDIDDSRASNDENNSNGNHCSNSNGTVSKLIHRDGENQDICSNPSNSDDEERSGSRDEGKKDAEEIYEDVEWRTVSPGTGDSDLLEEDDDNDYPFMY